jgi:hypothetical protein
MLIQTLSSSDIKPMLVVTLAAVGHEYEEKRKKKHNGPLL